MKHTVYKWFWAWSFEKEERWLNEKAAQGLALVGVGLGRYTFEECRPGEYMYRLEFLKTRSFGAESQQYIRFLEETGVEHVGTFGSWAYFRKNTRDGSFTLFSDLDSKLKHLRRISAFMLCIGTPQIIFLVGRIGDVVAGKTGMWYLLALHFAVALLFAIGIIKIEWAVRKLRREKAIRE